MLQLDSRISASFFHPGYMQMQKDCSRLRARELRKMLPKAAHAFRSSRSEERLWVKQRPRVGVVLAVAQHEAATYAHVLSLWRCYCARHGDCEVVVEWNNFLKAWDYPTVSSDEGRRYGLAWNRWFALQRHLEAYEWVFTADPDQFISHQCFLSYSFSDVLREAQVAQTASEPPVIVMRDFPHFHSLNSAGVFFRGSEAARLFLSLMTSRMYWLGIADFDQTAFDQSIIEFLDLWRNAKESGSDFSHSAKCVRFQTPFVDSHAMTDMYLGCWHAFMQQNFGPFGARGGSRVVPESGASRYQLCHGWPCNR